MGDWDESAYAGVTSSLEGKMVTCSATRRLYKKQAAILSFYSLLQLLSQKIGAVNHTNTQAVTCR